MKELRKMFYLIRYRINFTIYNIVATCHNCTHHIPEVIMHNAMKVCLKLCVALLCEGDPRLTKACIFEECSSRLFARIGGYP